MHLKRLSLSVPLSVSEVKCHMVVFWASSLKNTIVVLVIKCIIIISVNFCWSFFVMCGFFFPVEVTVAILGQVCYFSKKNFICAPIKSFLYEDPPPPRSLILHFALLISF